MRDPSHDTVDKALEPAPPLQHSPFIPPNEWHAPKARTLLVLGRFHHDTYPERTAYVY